VHPHSAPSTTKADPTTTHPTQDAEAAKVLAGRLAELKAAKAAAAASAEGGDGGAAAAAAALPPGLKVGCGPALDARLLWTTRQGSGGAANARTADLRI